VININSYTDFSDSPNSYWISSTEETFFPRLKEDVAVDVAIIGGGITGISTAFMLKQKGLRVAVIEADQILQGTTGHTTAKITSQHSLIYARLKNSMGEELARQYAQANESAIHYIASVVKEHKINCDFVWKPAYVYTQSDKYIQDIEDEVRAASELGIKARCEEDLPLPFAIKKAVCFENQAQFHPLKYLNMLAGKIPGQGSHIFEGTTVIDIEKNPLAAVTRQGHRITADKIVIASHYPFFDGGGLYFSRIYTEKSYVLGMKIKEKFPEGMFISAEEPTRSLRSQNTGKGELILVGGENHKTGDGENLNQLYQNLLDFAHQTFEVIDIPYRWSTQDCMTIDGVPYTGNITPRNPDIYVATGYGKWGMTNSTASAMIISDLITKGDNPWAPVYNPSRFKLGSVKNFMVQNLDVAKEYVTGKLERPDDIDIAPGEAGTVYMQGQKMGAYRDKEGELHLIDITCTHLGCELKWNEAEISWDCPCHGSRFSYEGDIIEGPAIYRLNHLHDEDNTVEARVFR